MTQQEKIVLSDEEVDRVEIKATADEISKVLDYVKDSFTESFLFGQYTNEKGEDVCSRSMKCSPNHLMRMFSSILDDYPEIKPAITMLLIQGDTGVENGQEK